MSNASSPGAASSDAIIAWGRDVLEAESQSLAFTSRLLNEAFVTAVQTIIRSEGKVVVTGLGKSGHIARKLAATLASTGTAAFFLHPSEALHGDLGMIQSQDVVLALAFGGETRETLEVVRFANRRNIPVVAITGKSTSSLARLSNIVLDGNVDREACPLNLAPTTSTVVAMGLGDALAVALMRARGFDKHDFAQYHPDGSLGRQLSLVSQHMKTDLMAIHADDDFNRVLEIITAHNYGIAGVFDANEQLIGAITDGDLRRALKTSREAVFTKHAKDIMTKNPKTIESDRLALDAVKLMEQSRITSLFVKDASGAIVGLIRMHDLLAAKIV
ncbi:MAG: KpsF/GutQ family sugar-phosphate isomerase [Chitinophagaceae bacterium]|nr:KpsF/GutQ family sugar-phosphate isomerase [Oligoflexus sp.]